MQRGNSETSGLRQANVIRLSIWVSRKTSFSRKKQLNKIHTLTKEQSEWGKACYLVSFALFEGNDFLLTLTYVFYYTNYNPPQAPISEVQHTFRFSDASLNYPFSHRHIPDPDFPQRYLVLKCFENSPDNFTNASCNNCSIQTRRKHSFHFFLSKNFQTFSLQTALFRYLFWRTDWIIYILTDITLQIIFLWWLSFQSFL